ncbi:MAG TPA: GNAT family N-acetyltransferase [Candidatus Dormibacteraeota bacterium]|jgi:CelD/BcsL family acetyltransferase involved in cellulose biosynthesis
MGAAAEFQGAGRRLAVGEITTEVHRDASGFDDLRTEWEDLERRSAEDNIFMTHHWQHAWWRELGGDADLHLLAFRHQDRMVGLASTYRKQAGGFPVVRFGGGLEVTDYTGFLVEGGYEEAVGRAFLEHCLESPGLVLDLHFLRSDGVTLAALTQAARDMDRRYNIENEEVSPRITLPGAFEAYFATLRKKDRHELRRKRRRLEDAGGWTVKESDAASLEEDLEAFFRLHAASTRAKADFLTPDVQRFFRHICLHLLEEGWLCLRLLVHQDRPVAAVLGFVYGNKLLLYNSGYEPGMLSLSPGLVLMSEEIRLAIEAGLEELDFLRGDEKYKYDLGATDVDLVHLTVELA